MDNQTVEDRAHHWEYDNPQTKALRILEGLTVIRDDLKNSELRAIDRRINRWKKEQGLRGIIMWPGFTKSDWQSDPDGTFDAFMDEVKTIIGQIMVDKTT